MKLIIELIKEHSPASYFVVAIVVLIGLGSLSSYVNPEGIEDSYVRNGQPKNRGVMASVSYIKDRAKKIREIEKRAAGRKNELASFSESRFFRSKLLKYYDALSVVATLEAFSDRAFKSLGRVENDHVSQEAYLSLTPHYLMISISSSGKAISITATRQAEELNLDRLKQLALRTEKTSDGIYYTLFEEIVSGKKYRHTAMETKGFGGHQVSWNIAIAPN